MYFIIYLYNLTSASPPSSLSSPNPISPLHPYLFFLSFYSEDSNSSSFLLWNKFIPPLELICRGPAPNIWGHFFHIYSFCVWGHANWRACVELRRRTHAGGAGSPLSMWELGTERGGKGIHPLNDACVLNTVLKEVTEIEQRWLPTQKWERPEAPGSH